MQVFRTYFKILNHYKGIIIMYFVIFLVVALVMSHNNGGVGNSSSNQAEELEGEKLNIAILDQDQKTLGKALTTYFESTHNLKQLEYDEEEILNELYWRSVDYVLIIPKGFEESLCSDTSKEMELQSMKVPGSFSSIYVEAEVDFYTSKLIGLLAAGYSLEEAEAVLMDLQEEKTQIKVASFVNAQHNDVTTAFFMYVPYLFISLGTIGVGMVLLRFNQREVKARTECGALPIKKRIAGLAAAIVTFGFILLAAVLVVAGILSKGNIYTDVRFPYILLNMFMFLLFSLSFGFLTGSIAKNNEMVNGIVNVASLALCFLGGVFVPMEFFSDGVARVARFLPTYWYVVTNTSISELKVVSPKFMEQILPQIGLVACYALAIFAVTVVIISSKKSRRI